MLRLIMISIKNIHIRLLFVILAFWYSQQTFAQIKDSTCAQKDLRVLLGKGVKEKSLEKKVMLLVLPKLALNPLNGVLYGAQGAMVWRFGPQETTRVSLLGATVAGSTKNQFITQIKSNVYTNMDQFFLQGDWRFYIYNAPTWGLGTNSPTNTYGGASWTWQENDYSKFDGSYSMAYNYVKFHEIVSIKLRKFLYLGVGHHLDYFYKIVDRQYNINANPPQLTPHSTYSNYHGFAMDKYTLSGASLNFVYDSRDNLNNPYKGVFVNLNYRYSPTFLGSNQNSSTLYAEFRAYKSLSKNKPRHLLAFWAFGSFQASGSVPYLSLMALGEDQRGRSGRGYISGRFRGEDYIYTELEYRFPLPFYNCLMGGVLFVNAATASNRVENVALFDYIRPAYGFGIRFMLNKQFRTNINIDFGFGKDSRVMYFSSNETF